MRLPSNPWLEDLSEVPALESSRDAVAPIPWKELSPSIGFIFASFLVAVGVHFQSIGTVGAGGLLIVVCLIGAAVLEFRADRIAAEMEARGSPSMLHASSDWAAIRQNRRRAS